MNAREQVREAVKKEMLRWVPNETWLPESRPEEYADAASDVWEPLLRDLFVAHEHLVAGVPKDGDWDAFRRASEALRG